MACTRRASTRRTILRSKNPTGMVPLLSTAGAAEGIDGDLLRTLPPSTARLRAGSACRPQRLRAMRPPAAAYWYGESATLMTPLSRPKAGSPAWAPLTPRTTVDVLVPAIARSAGRCDRAPCRARLLEGAPSVRVRGRGTRSGRFRQLARDHGIAERNAQQAGHRGPIAVLLARACSVKENGCQDSAPDEPGIGVATQRGVVGELGVARRGRRRLSGIADRVMNSPASKRD